MNSDKLFFRHVLHYYFDLKKIAVEATAYYPKCMVMKLHRKEHVVLFKSLRNGDFDVRGKERPRQTKKFEDFEL